MVTNAAPGCLELPVAAPRLDRLERAPLDALGGEVPYRPASDSRKRRGRPPARTVYHRGTALEGSMPLATHLVLVAVPLTIALVVVAVFLGGRRRER
jgi:hypothetical protein